MAMDLEQALNEVEGEMDHEREEMNNPVAWRAKLTREITNALRTVYGVPAHLATTSVLREIQEADDPVDVLEDLVIRHRIAVKCGDADFIRQEMAKQSQEEQDGEQNGGVGSK